MIFHMIYKYDIKIERFSNKCIKNRIMLIRSREERFDDSWNLQVLICSELWSCRSNVSCVIRNHSKTLNCRQWWWQRYNIDTMRYNAWPLGTKWPKITILLCYSKSWHSDIGHDNQTHVPMQATCLSFPLAFQFRPSQEWIKDVYVKRRPKYSFFSHMCTSNSKVFF